MFPIARAETFHAAFPTDIGAPFINPIVTKTCRPPGE